MDVILHHEVDKYLSRLNVNDRDRINAALDKLEKEPPESDIIPMSGETETFRLRVGSYRAIFRCKDNCILVTHLDPRGQVYNKKNKGNKR